MKKKKVDKLITEILHVEYQDQLNSQKVIIARDFGGNENLITVALYINCESGNIYCHKLDWGDTHKYETKNRKLLRFSLEYIEVAKKIAVEYMSKPQHELGFRLFTESGMCIG